MYLVIYLYNLKHVLYSIFCAYKKSEEKPPLGAWYALIMDFLSQCGTRQHSYIVFRGHTPYSLAT